MLLPHVELFWKTNKTAGTSLSASFYAWFLKKSISLLTGQISLSDCLLTLEILGNMWIAIVFFAVCEVIRFEINLDFLIKPFSYMSKTFRTKLKYLKNKKSFQDEIKTIFHYQGLLLKQIKPTFSGRWESNLKKDNGIFNFLMYLH